MGTLHAQTGRSLLEIAPDTITEEVKGLDEIAGDTGVPLHEVIEVVKMLEYRRRTEFMIDNGDRWDEQISGIGEAIEGLKS